MSATRAANGAASELLGGLSRLDVLLRGAVVNAEAVHGPGADRFRGLRIEAEEVERLLDRDPGEPILSVADGAESPQSATLASMAEELELSAFEIDVLLVALAPELDLRYERLYAYLQDDVTKKRPTVDLALNLLCDNAAERLARRRAFQADARLLRQRVLELVSDSSQPEAPLLARALKLDDQIVRLLLGTGGLDARLAGFCELVLPGQRGAERPSRDGGPAATGIDGDAGTAPLRIYLQGAPGSGRRAAAHESAAERGAPLLAADLTRMPAGAAAVLMREARLHDALLYLAGVDELRARDAAELDALLAAVRSHPGPVVLGGAGPWRRRAPSSSEEPLGVRVVPLRPASPAVRRRLWQRELKDRGLRVKPDELDALAERFRLTDGQIREAASEAKRHSEADRDRSLLEQLFTAARAQSGGDLAGLAAKLTSSFGWDDVVLPEDSLAQLRELCARVARRDRVLHEWGFEARLPLGRGVTALFSGPPGTGKTMAVEVVAAELGLDLYRIDLSGIVSKWIGETEKNIDRVFRAAEGASAILLFDEADALFGKRTEVSDSHDRYANLEVSYLLQKMEEHDGVAILATNRIADLDEAFTRRLSHVVRFPFPEVEERARIWESVWPPDTPLAEDVDCGLLARELAFSGAEIRNVALAAAFLAAGDDTTVTMEHVLHAARREYEKGGKSFPESGIAELVEAGM